MRRPLPPAGLRAQWACRRGPVPRTDCRPHRGGRPAGRRESRRQQHRTLHGQFEFGTAHDHLGLRLHGRLHGRSVGRPPGRPLPGIPGGFRRYGSRIPGGIGRLPVRVHDLMFDDLDDLAALIDHDVARTVDLVDEIAVDEYPRKDPAAQQQDQRPQHPDMRAQQRCGLDAEGTAPPRRTAKAPLVREGEAQRQRTEDQDEEKREDRMVEQQRALADDAHADEHHHHRDQNAGHAERVVDQQASQPGTRPAAEISRLDAQRGTFLGREQQPALVGRPGKKREQYGRGGEHPDEKQQQSCDPARTVAVGTLDFLPSVGG